MQTVTRIVRTAFLLAVFVAHPQPSFAYDIDVNCTPGCAGGNTRTLDCMFVDDDYDGTSSMCNGSGWSCYYGNCCQPGGDPALNVAQYFWDWCYYQSISQGGGYPGDVPVAVEI